MPQKTPIKRLILTALAVSMAAPAMAATGVFGLRSEKPDVDLKVTKVFVVESDSEVGVFPDKVGEFASIGDLPWYDGEIIDIFQIYNPLNATKIEASWDVVSTVVEIKEEGDLLVVLDGIERFDRAFRYGADPNTLDEFKDFRFIGLNG